MPSRATWNSLGRHPKPSKTIWNNLGSTLKRPPAPVKHLPQIIIPCSHLGAYRIIWNHLEISGRSDNLADTTFCESETSQWTRNRNPILRRTHRPPRILEATGASWNHLWQSGAIWGAIQGHLEFFGAVKPSMAIWCHLIWAVATSGAI